ncbi:MAG: type sorting protein, partial [Bacteroidota bacterium]|nr:type sorting protein [Bacteroidota bacterium]
KGEGIYYLSSNGKIWTRLSNKIMDIDSICYIIARGDYIVASGIMRLYVSTDKGQSWMTESYFEDKGEYIQCISLNSKLELVLGTNYGIYYAGTIDYGMKWSSMSDKMGNISCISIQYDYSGNLFACGVIWKSAYSIYQYNFSAQMWEERNGNLSYEPYINQFIVGDNQGLYIRTFDRILGYSYAKQIWDELPLSKISNLTDFVQNSNYICANNLTSVCIFNTNNSIWTPAINSPSINKLIGMEANPSGYLILCTEYELFRSTKTIAELNAGFFNKRFLVKDAQNNIKPNQTFQFYKSSCDNGVFLGDVVTDKSGYFNLNPDWGLKAGDTFKLEKSIEMRSAVKSGHEAVDNIMYELKINNMRFDGLGNPSCQIIGQSDDQQISLDNTNIYLNLVICTEFDAKTEYLDSLASWVRKSADFMYDVTDGHIILKKVAIYDNRAKWVETDVRIFSMNMLGPGACFDGIYQPTPVDAYICFERRWFGNYEADRAESFRSDWFRIRDEDRVGAMFTTLIHEIGHYFLGFKDEYLFTDNTKQALLPMNYNYGFMQYQYLNSPPWNSEMSSADRYPSADYKYTHQWVHKGKDCWSDFETKFEKTYPAEGTTYFCPIRKPSERTLSSGLTYLLGPSDFPTNQRTCNIGNTVDISIFDQNVSAGEFTFRLLNPRGNPMSRAKAWLGEPLPDGSILFKGYQGETNNSGQMRVIGARVWDVVLTYGNYDYIDSQGNRIIVVNVYNDFRVTSISRNDKNNDEPLDETLDVTAKEMKGDYQAIPSIEFDPSGRLTVKALVNKQFNDAASLLYTQSSDTLKATSFNFNNNQYDCIIDNYQPGNGIFMLKSKDVDNNEFFTIFNYRISEFNQLLSSPDGVAELYCGEISQNVQFVGFQVSDLDPLRNGLQSFNELGSSVYSLSSYPESLQGSDNSKMFISLKYTNSKLSLKNPELLRIFKWLETTNEWTLIGGIVDTVLKKVSCEISSLGIYALFSIDDPQGFDDIPGFAFKLEIMPNPAQNNASVQFRIPEYGLVKISLYNQLGIKLSDIFSDYLTPYLNKINFSTSALTDGVYYIEMEYKGSKITQKFIVIK